MEFSHVSVLLHEAIESLNIRPDGVYIDGTAGGAGHSCEIASRLTTGRLIAIDKDPDAIRAAAARLAPFPQARVVREDFRNLRAVAEAQGILRADGILLDLGVSSQQLDDAARGFSYHSDAPLDMRMSQSGMSAYDLVNGYDEQSIIRILRDYGEERFAARIARAIVQARSSRPIETTLQLAELIKEAIPAATRREGGHPAKRSFQAIRIAVNDELGSVERMLADAMDRLNPGGRLAVITFHSLEDRIVKNAMQNAARGCTCPPEFPVCVCGKKPKVKILTRKPIVSGQEELDKNPRARSAKLRVAEAIGL